MSNGDFDFGSLVDGQFKGIRHGYKFGKAFNDDKLIVRPKKPVVEAGSEDNVTIKAAWEAGEAIAGVVEKEVKGGYEVTVAGNIPLRSSPKGPLGGVTGVVTAIFRSGSGETSAGVFVRQSETGTGTTCGAGHPSSIRSTSSGDSRTS